jgi:hypothetical protein
MGQSDLHRTHSKDENQSNFLYAGHPQMDDHRNRKRQQSEVCSDVDRCSRCVDCSAVNTRPSCNPCIPVLRHRSAWKDECEYDGEAVAHYNEHKEVDSQSEPSKWR